MKGLALAGLYLLSLPLVAQDAVPARKTGVVEVGEVFEMASAIMGETRTFRVSVPSSYARSSDKYPLVLVLDGEYYFSLAAEATRFLAQFQLMPEAVVVAVHNTDRRRDMTPPDISLLDVGQGKGDAFLSFLADELLPFMQQSYRLHPLTVLIGHSHGALFGVYAASQRPDLFRWHVAIDAPLHLSDHRSERRFQSFLAARPGPHGRLITIERRFGWTDRFWNDLVSSAPPKYRLHRMSLPDETHETMVYRGIYEGLKWLFADLAAKKDALLSYVALQEQYEAYSEAYGYSVEIPLNALSMGAEDHLFAGKTDEAERFIVEVRRRTGKTSEVSRLEQWAKELREHPLPETYDVMVQSPPPAPERMQPFLGTWDGFVNDAFPYRVVVSFELVDGTVMTQLREYSPSGEDEVGRLVPVIVTRMLEDGTLEWGSFNGMRPRTAIRMFAGKIDADGNLAGVRGPKGMSLPPEIARKGMLGTRFLLKRRTS